MKLKPLGAVSVDPVTAIDTVPPAVPAGTTTDVAVPPGGGLVAVLTVVVLSIDAVPVAVEGGGLPACGVTEFDGAEAELGQAPFVAVTVKMYEAPLIRPPTVQDNAPLVEQLEAAGELSTV